MVFCIDTDLRVEAWSAKFHSFEGEGGGFKWNLLCFTELLQTLRWPLKLVKASKCMHTDRSRRSQGFFFCLCSSDLCKMLDGGWFAAERLAVQHWRFEMLQSRHHGYKASLRCRGDAKLLAGPTVLVPIREPLSKLVDMAWWRLLKATVKRPGQGEHAGPC